MDGQAGEAIDRGAIARAAEAWRAAGSAAALTGAGISVESGIPDFRSRDGIWAHFPVRVFGVISTFRANPARSWAFFRAIHEVARGADPGKAHIALARLEAAGHLSGIVTQNIDGLHRRAGSRRVVEIHGSDREVHCVRCGHVEATPPGTFEGDGVPSCPACGGPLKPRIVLFGEPILDWDDAVALVAGAPILLVVGTSAEVEPAASLPLLVLERGGMIVECNRCETPLTAIAAHVLRGGAGAVLEALSQEMLGDSARHDARDAGR
ncbi:MAG: NAD-dependent protein deacylase [Planctomycetes bacterium]|nr:NAD-dependent protein deacylase [Planctomycetota bacterium]